MSDMSHSHLGGSTAAACHILLRKLPQSYTKQRQKSRFIFDIKMRGPGAPLHMWYVPPKTWGAVRKNIWPYKTARPQQSAGSPSAQGSWNLPKVLPPWYAPDWNVRKIATTTGKEPTIFWSQNLMKESLVQLVENYFDVANYERMCVYVCVCWRGGGGWDVTQILCEI